MLTLVKDDLKMTTLKRSKQLEIEMSKTPREFTKYLLESIDEGLISAQAVVEMCLSYMSDDNVRDMMEINDLPMPYDFEAEEAEMGEY